MNEHPTNRLSTHPTPPKLKQETRAESEPRTAQIPRYRVVLLQNASSDMMFVVRTIMELTRLCRAEATHKMWQAHHSGRSPLLETYRERAEMFVELLAGRGLSATIEPA